jgi:hypothetical protein
MSCLSARQEDLRFEERKSEQSSHRFKLAGSFSIDVEFGFLSVICQEATIEQFVRNYKR